MSGSPWGVIQYASQIVRGVRHVCTAGHGGIMVTKNFAKKHLSNSARQRAIRYGNYFCYEEDCDCAIPLHELESRFSEIYKDKSKDMKNRIIRTLSRYHADYLLERGEVPVEPEYSRFLERIQ